MSADDSLPTIRRGVIDLIFREPSGRVPEADIPALVSYYEPQVSAYVDAWEAVVGELVVEAGLFFTHSGRFVAVEGVPIV